MVVLSSRFTVLAALSSIAAVTVLPPSVSAAALAIREPSEVQTPLAARHSRKDRNEGVIHAAASTSGDSVQDGRDGQDSPRSHGSSHDKKTSSAAPKDTPTQGSQRQLKPLVPLPASMDKHGHKKPSGSGEDGGAGGQQGSKEHEKEAVSSLDDL